MENTAIEPTQITPYVEPIQTQTVGSVPTQKQNTPSLTTSAAKAGGNIFMTILKLIFGGIKTFLKFFFALSLIPKIVFLLILFFFIAFSFLAGYFVGRNNYDKKIKEELEQAQVKLENIEKEIRN